MSELAASQPVAGAFSVSAVGGVKDLSKAHPGDAQCIQPVTVPICRTDKMSLSKLAAARGVSTRDMAKALLVAAIRDCEALEEAGQ